MSLISLHCEVCGHEVTGLFTGTNGSELARARSDLIRALRWSGDGSRCEYCKTLAVAGRRPAPCPEGAVR